MSTTYADKVGRFRITRLPNETYALIAQPITASGLNELIMIGIAISQSQDNDVGVVLLQ